MKYLIALLLAGCATQEMVWDKPGASNEEFNAAVGQCKAQALSVPGALMGNTLQVAAVFRACMEGKNFYQRPAN